MADTPVSLTQKFDQWQKAFRTTLNLAENMPLPPAVQFILEQYIKNRATDEGLKDLVAFMADRKIKDFGNLTAQEKDLILQHIGDFLRDNPNTMLDRKTFSKEIRTEALLNERDLYLDSEDLKLFGKNSVEKLRLSLLRKYGPSRTPKFDSPLRAEYKQALADKKISRCLEIMYELQFRKISFLKKVSKPRLIKLQSRLLAQAKADSLDIKKLEQIFNQDSSTIWRKTTNDSAGFETLLKNTIAFINKK